MHLVLLAKFGGKGERISRDGLGDGVIRGWGDGKNLNLGFWRKGEGDIFSRRINS